MLKLLVLPKSTNPYQSLLYTPLENKVTVSYGFLTNTLRYSYPIVLLTERLRGTKLLHLHWPYWLTIRVPNTKLRQFIAMMNIYMFVILAKLLGFKIIRTMHNVLPHEQQTLDDIKIAKLLARHSSVIIVHSAETTKQMAELEIDITKNVIIPIGSYAGLYQSNMSARTAREQLGINEQEFVILFFGIIRDYKGVDDLLRAFRAIKQPQTRLIIAGACDDQELSQQIHQLSRGIPVTFFNQYIPEDQVCVYFQACDVVCLPFKRITTSSSVLLAMAFKKPVIVPRIGALNDIPENAALFYDQERNLGLQNTLIESITQSKANHRIANAGYDYSESLSWNNIAIQTYQVYKGLLK